MGTQDDQSENSRLLASNTRRLSKTGGYDVTNLGPLRRQSIVSTDCVFDEKPLEETGGKRSGLKFFTGLSGRQRYTLCLIALASFLAGVALSLLGPFFPTEATKKGMNMTFVGFVFAVFEIVIFFTAPIVGNYLLRIGPRFAFVAGIFIAGTCNILFGTLQYCPNGTPFIVMSILIRAVEALGFSSYTTSSYAIMTSQFKDNVGFTLGILETGSGVGFMLGPTIGGALYELGGFGVPFYVAGVAVLINAVAVYKFLPDVEELPAKRHGSVLTLLRSPMVVVQLGSVMVGMIGITTYDATFAKRMEPFQLSVGIIGVVFGVVALLYCIMSSIWGYVSDSKNVQAPLIIAGLLVFGWGYSLIGPSFLFPFLPASSLPVVLVGLACIGASFGCLLIPTIKCMIIGAHELGFQNNMDTYALVSGLYKSVQTLGGFVGPIGVGYLVQEFDFPVAYGLVGVANFVMMVVTLVFFTYRNLSRRKKDETISFDEESVIVYPRTRAMSVSEL